MSGAIMEVLVVELVAVEELVLRDQVLYIDVTGLEHTPLIMEPVNPIHAHTYIVAKHLWYNKYL